MGHRELKTNCLKANHHSLSPWQRLWWVRREKTDSADNHCHFIYLSLTVFPFRLETFWAQRRSRTSVVSHTPSIPLQALCCCRCHFPPTPTDRPVWGLCLHGILSCVCVCARFSYLQGTCCGINLVGTKKGPEYSETFHSAYFGVCVGFYSKRPRVYFNTAPPSQLFKRDSLVSHPNVFTRWCCSLMNTQRPVGPSE